MKMQNTDDTKTVRVSSAQQKRLQESDGTIKKMVKASKLSEISKSGIPVSPKCPVSETSDERMQKSLNLIQETHLQEYSDDESIDENDFAENYHDVKSDDGSNKMDLDYSSIEKVKELEKLTKPMKSETSKSALPVFQKSLRTYMYPADSARKALFEKALLSGTPKINDSLLDHKLSVAPRAAMFENESKEYSGTKSTNFKEPQQNNLVKSPVKIAHSSAKIHTQEINASSSNKTSAEAVTSVLSPTKTVGNTLFIQEKMIENSIFNWQDKQAAKAVEERKQEISSLVNHWGKLPSSSSIENNSQMFDNDKMRAVMQEPSANDDEDVVILRSPIRTPPPVITIEDEEDEHATHGHHHKDVYFTLFEDGTDKILINSIFEISSEDDDDEDDVC